MSPRLLLCVIATLAVLALATALHTRVGADATAAAARP
jgi:hypothetical protein